MRTRHPKWWALTLAAGLGALVAAAPCRAADEGAELYGRLCAGCHGEQGEGQGDYPPVAGPDAIDDPEELASIIREGAGDMPAFPDLGPTPMASLVAFIQDTLGSGESAAKPGAPVPEGDPERGRGYFSGRLRLSGGGAPCLACHVAGSHGAVTGGSLASDLTDAFQRYGGARGVYGALKAMPYPVMRASYAGKGLTDQERADLVAFFQALAASDEVPSAWADRFWMPAVLGTAVLFVVVAAIGSRRGPSPARRLRQSRG